MADRRRFDEDRLDIELALLLCHWFGSAVLWSVDDGHITSDGVRRRATS
ncbi:hypothetical protein [Nocardia vinacea]|nr:hypothetical protein [Nocardia vinacea]